MQLYTLCTGERVHRYQKSIVVPLEGKRRVLSTGPNNGGLREDLTAVFNNDGTVGAGMAMQLKAPTYGEHMDLLSRELGLDPATATGLSTAAQMENVAIKTATYKDITVTAIVTGGIAVNGGRAGDPASWDELEERSVMEVPHGTINIMLFCNVDLTYGALVRSLVTCTEAKTAALQELLAPSRYSNGLATGSGTDGTIIVANAESSIRLDNAGKHCKLGELIGRTVKAAVKEALFLQSGLCPEEQRAVLKRVDRFGITGEGIWEELGQPEGLSKAEFWQRMERSFSQESLVAEVSLYVHLMDQLNWGLLSAGTVFGEAQVLLQRIAGMDSSGVWPEEFDLEEALAELAKRLQSALVNRLKLEYT